MPINKNINEASVRYLEYNFESVDFAIFKIPLLSKVRNFCNQPFLLKNLKAGKI
jgi:hypothetical protein